MKFTKIYKAMAIAVLFPALAVTQGGFGRKWSNSAVPIF